MDNPAFYTTRQLADRWHITVRGVQARIDRGLLPAERQEQPNGRFRYLIPAAAVDEAENTPVTFGDAVRARRATARERLDEAIAAGRLEPDPSAETLGKIATILRQHYAEQADRTAS